MTSRKRKRIPENLYIQGALSRCRNTQLYRERFKKNTVANTRTLVRNMGYPAWYSMKKNELVSVIVLDIYAKRIQRFVKTGGNNVRRRESMFNGLDEEKCPISLEVVSNIPIHNRYLHTNYWFDREELAGFLRSSCDFIHPVTRIEFTEKDVCDIDASLMDIFNNKSDIRSEMVSMMKNFQCLENELEEIYEEMVEMAFCTPTRGQFDVNMSYCEVQFEQCFDNLVMIDRERCVMVLKSLPDLIDAYSQNRYYISKTRKNELKVLVKEFIARANF